MQIKRVLIISVLTLLSACTNAEMQERNINHAMNNAAAASQKCLDEISNDEKYSPIISHIPFAKGYTPTLSELNNRNKATEAEAKLVSMLRDASISCEQASIQSLIQYVPSMANVFIDKQNETNENYSQLVNRKITWGKFAKEDQKIRAKSIALANEKWQQLQSQLTAQKNSESAQLRDGLMNYAAFNQRQQEIQAQQNTANQYRMLNCTTSYMGSMASTNCF